MVKVNKKYKDRLFRMVFHKESRSRDSPPAAGRPGDIIPSRRSAILSGAFLFNRSYFPIEKESRLRDSPPTV